MGHNIYGHAGDFFNQRASSLRRASDQASALGLRDQAKRLADEAGLVCQLYAEYCDFVDGATQRAARAAKERAPQPGPASKS